MPVDSFQNRDPQKIVEENLKKLQKERMIADMRSARASRSILGEDDDARPTGYNNDSDDEEERELPLLLSLVDTSNEGITNTTSNSTDNAVFQFVQNVYIGSPTDPPRRQQARFVVRSITLISFVFGLAFTALWYLAPGKFVSYKGDENIPTSPRSRLDFIDPNRLLNIPSGTSEYFDDAEGLPEKERSRVPYPKTDNGEVIKSRQMDL
eukprot:gene25393-30662_t